MSLASRSTPAGTCPFSQTDDKMDEAHYFLHRSLEEYHHPDPFRWNLNAFLQALRSVGEILNMEMQIPSIDLPSRRQINEKIREDPLLAAMSGARNIVAHKGTLQAASSVEAGLFRWRRCKMALALEIDPATPTEHVLHMAREFINFGEEPDEHPSDGEQAGVERVWRVPDVGDGEVTTICHRAYSRMSEVLSEAHGLIGARSTPVDAEPGEAHSYLGFNVLLETDLDPSLIQRWGWE